MLFPFTNPDIFSDFWAHQDNITTICDLWFLLASWARYLPSRARRNVPTDALSRGTSARVYTGDVGPATGRIVSAWVLILSRGATMCQLLAGAKTSPSTRSLRLPLRLLRLRLRRLLRMFIHMSVSGRTKSASTNPMPTSPHVVTNSTPA